jgi:hypothetical protein
VGRIVLGNNGYVVHCEERQKFCVSGTVGAAFYHRQMIIFPNSKTHQQCQILKKKKKNKKFTKDI